jgi:hypothetical protein
VWVEELGRFVDVECFVPQGDAGPVQCFHPMRLSGEGECQPVCPLPIYSEREWRAMYGVLYFAWVSVGMNTVVLLVVLLNAEKRRFPGVGLTILLATIREFPLARRDETKLRMYRPRSSSAQHRHHPSQRLRIRIPGRLVRRVRCGGRPARRQHRTGARLPISVSGSAWRRFVGIGVCVCVCGVCRAHGTWYVACG